MTKLSDQQILEIAKNLYKQGKYIGQQADEITYSAWIQGIQNLASGNLFNNRYGGQINQLDRLTIHGRALQNSRESYFEILGTLKGMCEDSMIKENVQSDKTKKIFISHQHADSDIVEQLIKFFKNGIEVRSNDIFCTSGDFGTMKIDPGERVYDVLQKQLKDGETLVIAVITENYLTSKPCLMELGASWVMGHTIIPLLISNDKRIFDECSNILSGVMMVTFEDGETATKLLNATKDRIVEMFNLKECADYKDYIDSRKNLIESIIK